ncbi:19389_t:CDS:2 [Cetraspora pellucida]|uniref:19389_t:CDS:1 n=1 Tax=Cetraspora pellucida TaxID=1433469 RepID=A0A9N9NXX2_9GLOM|nr:19389_t:CDS:2 [Cetraspora pellucida]
MLQEIEKEEHAEDLKMSVLQASHYIAKSWKEVEDFYQTTDPVLNDIANAIEILGLPYSMQVEEFLEISDENIVYEVLSDEEIIRELVETFRTNDLAFISIEGVKDEDDSPEISIVSIDTANTSLKTMHTFLLQQDDMEDILEKIKKFINKTKMSQIQQNKIDQFF